MFGKTTVSSRGTRRNVLKIFITFLFDMTYRVASDDEVPSDYRMAARAIFPRVHSSPPEVSPSALRSST